MRHSWLIALGVSFVVAFSAHGQGTLRVPPGALLVIDPTNAPLLLDALIMEDNSRIQVVGLPEWKVQIQRMRIGRNCTIDIRGFPGADADQARRDHGGTADYCNNGDDNASSAGDRGGAGSTGPDLTILTGVESIGDLTILTEGGRGGAGGPGGKGEKGGQARCYCSAGGGAKGGRGGNGGPGGRTATVTFVWFPLGGMSPPSSNPGLKIRGNPGTGGAAGPGGPGGDGGDGSCGRGHAGSGWPGDAGTRGVDGSRNDNVIRLIPREGMATAAITLGIQRRD